MEQNLCFCGHDCARCVTYLATVRDDDGLRERSREFYRKSFGIDLPAEEFRCLGGRSDDVFRLCRECPFAACCRKRGLDACGDCPEFPCAMLAEYRGKYVNKTNQIP